VGVGARRSRAGVKKAVSSAARAAASVGGADRPRAQLAEGKAKTQLSRVHALGDLRWQEIATGLDYSSLAEKLIYLSVAAT
jgi:hypothetical protein